MSESPEKSDSTPSQKAVDSNGQPLSTEGSKPHRDGSNSPFFKPISQRIGRLPAFLDHFNWRDLTTLFKCSLAVWVYSLFMWINKTESIFGQATFFGAIVLFIAPPSGVIFFTLLASGTLIVGVCLAWAWGTITMKAALATRPAADLQRQFAALQASANTTNNQQASGQSAYAQIAIYNGDLLDNRVTITYFCMICLFVYFMARLRVKAPKLTLLAIFGLVISDIYLTIAPLIPTFQGTIPQVLIKPAALATGVGLACNVLIFPQTTSSIVLEGMQKVLHLVNPFVDASITCFEDPALEMELGRLEQAKAAAIGAFKALQPNLGFLALDMNYGRWNCDDIKTLQGPLRQVLVTFVGMIELHIARAERLAKETSLTNMLSSSQAASSLERPAGHQHAVAMFNIREQLKQPDGETIVQKSMRALAPVCGGLLSACEETVSTILAGLTVENKTIFNRASKQETDAQGQSQLQVLEKLRLEIGIVSDKAAAERLLAHYQPDLTDSDGKLADGQMALDDRHLDHKLVTSLVHKERILNFANALESLLTAMVELDACRAQAHVWFPFGLSKLFKWGLEKDDVTLAGEQAPLDEENSLRKVLTRRSSSDPSETQRGSTQDTQQEMSAAQQLEAMERSGSRKRSSSGRILIAVVHWFSSTEGLFAVRMVVATLAIGVVAVTRQTAGFFYREKGLWALIMAQTGLVPYTADLFLGIIMRAAGTIIGAVIGLVAWYIGAGHGPGNPYGMAAIMAPVIILLMWTRLFASPALLQGCIMSAATCFLVVGYSWADTHIPSYGNPGVGYEVFWRRMLLVLIGFAVATIVTLFPRPPSASRHQRRLLSETLGAIKTQYALLVANCAESTVAPPTDLRKVTEGTAIRIAELLGALGPQIKLSKLEFSTSNLDPDTLATVCRLAGRMNQFTAELLIYAPQLPSEMKARFVELTGCLEERTVTDVMGVLALIAQALKSGDPLPAAMPVLTARMVNRNASARDAEAGRGSSQVGQSAAPASRRALSRDMLGQEGVRRYCCAMVAFAQLLGVIDELVLVVKKAVGETSRVDPAVLC